MSSDRITRFRDRLTLPLIAAPMFLVSGVELVVAACRNGVIGSFPTANCRSSEQLDAWLSEMEARLGEHAARTGRRAAPICPNLIVHRSNVRLMQDMDVLLRHRPEIVITSVGSPAPVLGALHDAGALVLADVASIRHAERAAQAGVDGLVLLTAGAGGQTGWLNPFAFVRAVRAFFDGIIVLAGGISDGQALHAAEVLGCDLAYMGTRFIATRESMADDRYKQMPACRPACCGRRSSQRASIPAICPRVARSTSPRISTLPRARRSRGAGATSGAAAIRRRA